MVDYFLQLIIILFMSKFMSKNIKRLEKKLLYSQRETLKQQVFQKHSIFIVNRPTLKSTVSRTNGVN